MEWPSQTCWVVERLERSTWFTNWSAKTLEGQSKCRNQSMPILISCKFSGVGKNSKIYNKLVQNNLIFALIALCVNVMHCIKKVEITIYYPIQNFGGFFTSWMKIFIKMQKLERLTKMLGRNVDLIVILPFDLLPVKPNFHCQLEIFHIESLSLIF